MSRRTSNESVREFLGHAAGQSRRRRKEPKPNTDRKFYLYDRYVGVSELVEVIEWFVAQIVHFRDHKRLPQDAEERRRRRRLANLKKGKGDTGENPLIVELAAGVLSRFAWMHGVSSAPIVTLVDEITRRQADDFSLRRLQTKLVIAKEEVIDEIVRTIEILLSDDDECPSKPELPGVYPENAGRRVTWDPDNNAFRSNKKIIEQYSGKEIAPARVVRLYNRKLNRFVEKHGVPFMRKGQRRRVHAKKFDIAFRKHGQELAKTKATPGFRQKLARELTAQQKTAKPWECAGCGYEMTAPTRPDKCPKCHGHTMTRLNLPAS